MAQREDEEEQYLATLHELEATQEDIASYQGLLKDLPEIYERKFNERLKPILDRQHHLIDEREQLLQQLHQSLPTPEGEPRKLLPPAPPTPSELGDANPPRHSGRGRPWWFLGLAVLGLTIGWHWHKQTVPGTPPTPRNNSAPPFQPQAPPQGASVSGEGVSASGAAPERAPATTLRGRVVERAVAEWTFFDRPTLQDGRLLRVGRKEGDSGQWQRVITYWREGLRNNSVHDDADVRSRDHPWSAAFIAYLSSLTNVQYSATQYALFSSLMLLAPKFLAGFSGVAVDAVGYAWFFTGTALLGVPVLLLVWLASRFHSSGD